MATGRAVTPAMLSLAETLGIQDPKQYSYYRLCELIDNAPPSPAQWELARELELNPPAGITYHDMHMLLTDVISDISRKVLRDLRDIIAVGNVIVYDGTYWAPTKVPKPWDNGRLMVWLCPYFKETDAAGNPRKPINVSASRLRGVTLADPNVLADALASGQERYKRTSSSSSRDLR